MISSTLRRLIPLLTLVTALCPLWSAFFMMSVYQQHHMPVAAVWRAGSPNLMDAFLYVTAAYLYWRWSSARIPLQILAVVEGSVALYDWYNMRYFIGSWSVLHGDIVAVGAWHAVGLMAIGVLAIIHFTAERLERSPRGAPSAGSTSA